MESTKEFKEKFLRERSNFYPKSTEIMSLDARSLYNINKTVKFIVDEIYKNRKDYFDDGTREHNGRLKPIPAPPKNIFKEF